MFLKIHPAFIIIAIIIFPLCALAENPSHLFFFQPWGQDFHLRPTETGDTLSIGAVFSSDSELFVNDLAAGTVVAIDKSGKIVSKIPLEQIGRGNYSGDDFIVKDGQFIFVNSIDKRLEYFSGATGKHLKSVSLPTGVLAGQAKRSNRIIDRIFLTDKAILVGNGNLVFDLETGLKKTVSAVTVIKAFGTARYALLSGKKRFTVTADILADSATGQKTAILPSHFAISGKRFFVFNGHLFSIIAAKEGIKIVDCGL